MIFSVTNLPLEEVQVLFGHNKQQSLALGSNLPLTLKCLVID
jgi:hypothetical protein